MNEHRLKHGRPHRSEAGQVVNRLKPTNNRKLHGKKCTILTYRKKRKMDRRVLQESSRCMFHSNEQQEYNAGVFREREVAAYLKEYEQIGILTMLSVEDPDKLSKYEKRKAILEVNLIKEKRCGNIKGRTCTYEKKHNISRGAIFITDHSRTWYRSSAEFWYTRDVPTCFITRTQEVTNEIWGRICGHRLWIQLWIQNIYDNWLCREGTICTDFEGHIKELKKYLHWYEFYPTTLKYVGFKLNPYNMCVANKMKNRSQCTVVWFVDDNENFQVYHNVNTTIVNMIKKKCGKLVRTTCKKHTFLSMVIGIIGNWKVQITTPQHIEEVIDYFKEEVNTNLINPAQSIIFSVHNKSKTL